MKLNRIFSYPYQEIILLAKNIALIFIPTLLFQMYDVYQNIQNTVFYFL